jgi:hypothetical protein
MEATVQVRVPDANIQSAQVSTVAVGDVSIGPITVGELVVHNTDFAVTAGVGVLQGVTVTVTIHVSFTWHIHIGLPDGIPDIDEGDTYDLGSLSFSMPVGTVTLPALNNIHLHIPTLVAENVTTDASPLSNLQVTNLDVEAINAHNIVIPSAGFTIAGLTFASAQGTDVSFPAAGVDTVVIRHVHGDPVQLPAFTLGSLNVPSVQIPDLTSSAPLDIPADLAARTLSFDAGILRAGITLRPSAVSHIDRLELTNAQANATVGQIVLSNVVLPFDVLNLTLSDIGINTVVVPSFDVS